MSKAPICSCGLQMVERRRKVDGRPFYGCAKFARGGCSDVAEHEDVEQTEEESSDDL